MVTVFTSRHRLGGVAPVLAGAAISGVVLVGCNGDDGAKRLDDEAFCARLAELREGEAAAAGDDTTDITFGADLDVVVSEMKELAPVAPNDELRDAIETMIPALERLGSLEEGSEDSVDAFGDAFGAVFSLVFDPKVQKAAKTLEAYVTDTCGFPPPEDFPGWDLGPVGDPTDDDPTGTVDPSDETVGEQSGSATDDLDAGELHEKLKGALEELAPGHAGSSVFLGNQPGTDATVVELDLTGASSVDAIGLCEALGAEVDAATSDPAVVVEVRVDGELAASRAPGGACLAE